MTPTRVHGYMLRNHSPREDLALRHQSWAQKNRAHWTMVVTDFQKRPLAKNKKPHNNSACFGSLTLQTFQSIFHHQEWHCGNIFYGGMFLVKLFVDLVEGMHQPSFHSKSKSHGTSLHVFPQFSSHHINGISRYMVCWYFKLTALFQLFRCIFPVRSFKHQFTIHDWSFNCKWCLATPQSCWSCWNNQCSAKSPQQTPPWRQLLCRPCRPYITSPTKNTGPPSQLNPMNQ